MEATSKSIDCGVQTRSKTRAKEATAESRSKTTAPTVKGDLSCVQTRSKARAKEATRQVESRSKISEKKCNEEGDLSCVQTRSKTRAKKATVEARQVESDEEGAVSVTGVPKVKARSKRKQGKETAKVTANKQKTSDLVYAHWKSTIPVIYDFLASHELARPSCSCRWGPSGDSSHDSVRRVYISEQGYDLVPNALVSAEFKVAAPGDTRIEHLPQFEDKLFNPFAGNFKAIVHPGKVKRIRVLQQDKNIVATLSNSHEVFIWNMNTQANCSVSAGAESSKPDCLLTGVDDTDEQCSLAFSTLGQHVVSGGVRGNVSIWSIPDYTTSLAVSGSTNPGDSKVRARVTFEGHTETVKDVQFCSERSETFCSVGDDSLLVLWDVRSGPSQKADLKEALNSVDWRGHHILTGSVGGLVCMLDDRKISEPVHQFENKAPVLCVKWAPCKDNSSSIFGSSGDCIVNIWDSTKAGEKLSGLVFGHHGHRGKVVDFEWDVDDPNTLVSVSHDTEKSGDTHKSGGGALQIWRMSSEKPWSTKNSET